MLDRVRRRPSQKQRIGGNRERESARNRAIWGGGVRRSAARTRASTGGNGRKKNQPRTVGFSNVGTGTTEQCAAGLIFSWVYKILSETCPQLCPLAYDL